ncbi:hypothetical protein P170DRAFT_425780 [Aspergillus steynii IBT 23096]|uniref:Uncharacterized protein n=1 Tax=Aspergillus steynii IBT 23096 TaxID=1392250 RepID=A0A2I2G792_9EURO|nr:uncharacterized protein P170DRAFT_425780 [Aspergillus steynii IBT 23096]PLB48757.1 hypothetical protein P170DRAFT_425780 [Aspergillus steynii IBT 23096]
MQNDDGYLVIPGDEPPDDLLAAVEAEISSPPRRCGPNGQQLMKFGVKLPHEAWFQEYLGCSSSDAKKVGETRVRLFNNNRPGRFVPGPPGTVLIYRAATRHGLSPETGFFRIVPRSHRMTAAEIKRAKSISITLSARDTLYMPANTTIEYIISGESVALCEALSSSLDNNTEMEI